jgi:hypothetical protein
MKIRNCLLILICSIVIVFWVHTGTAQNADMYAISIPLRCLRMTSDERITKYKIVVQAAFITGLLKVAHGWTITVDDNLSQNPTVTGVASHGVAYMTLDNVTNGAFDSFLIIQKDKFVANAGVPLDVSIKMSIASMSQAATREVIIRMKDLVVSPYPQ